MERRSKKGEGRRERRQGRKVEGRRRGEKGGGDCGWYFLHTLSASYMDQGKHEHLPEPDLEKGLAIPLGSWP